jgi:radical SAM superfamily enzyme YgiQ (UPF0313 family)
VSDHPGKSFSLYLIKPSHYDDEGYVIQWYRSSIPSNSLACVYGLALDCINRQVLGADVEIKLEALDETNTRIRPAKIARTIRQRGGEALIAMVGVQTNQFPRAMDLARQFQAEGLTVAMGGFHVSGCLAMLPELPADLQEALDLGICLFAGELEGRFDNILRAARDGTLEPLYNYMDELPGIDGEPVPFLPAQLIHRTSGARTSFDAGRGCPYLCSFCTIINVQGRRSRRRTADDVERIVRDNVAQGVYNFFISDDNMARNQDWEVIFDRLIHLRENEGIPIYIIIQVDTLCHKIAGFIEKAGRAGVNRVFLGMESINPDSLKSARKGQNQITEYRKLFQAWHDVGALTYAGYILGFPGDTPESIERDIRIIQRELPVDLLEFFILTPLPGSQDHKELHAAGVWMEPDMNKYDLEHVTTAHSNMSPEELQHIYRKAWDIYYEPAHVLRVLRRARACGYPPDNMMMKLLVFHASIKFEKIHPLEGGIFRRKYRQDRRSGLGIENPLVFWTRFVAENVSKYARFARMYLAHRQIARIAAKLPEISPEEDVALRPAQDDDWQALSIYNATDAAKNAVDRVRRKKARRKAGSAAGQEPGVTA